MTKLIFWCCAFLLLFFYTGYPAFLLLISFFRKRKIFVGENEPTVTIVVPCYNEESIIRDKIENLLSLDYPKDKLEIFIVSDGSTDKTEKICSEYISRGITFFALPRQGKNNAMNFGANKSNSEIIVFSDAPSILKKSALREQMKYFSDKRIGLVSGRLEAIGEGSAFKKTSFSGTLNCFYRYENFIRQKEGLIGSLVSATGTFCAIRKSIFSFLPGNVADDFYLPLLVRMKHFFTYYSRESVSIRRGKYSKESEFAARVRTQRGAISTIIEAKGLLNPIKHPIVCFQLFLHKILRWLSPFFLPIFFIANIFLLEKPIYLLIFVCQIIFYSLALLGFLLKWEEKKLGNLFLLPLHFCIVNAAIYLGTVSYKKVTDRWETIR